MMDFEVDWGINWAKLSRISKIRLAFVLVLSAVFIVYFFVYPGLITTSIKAKDLALISWKFIEGSAIQERNRGKEGFWISEFDCRTSPCSVAKSSIFAPPAYLQALRLLARTTKDLNYSQKELSEALFFANLCKLNAASCISHFSAIASPVLTTENREKLGVLLKVDALKKPQNFEEFISKLDRFIILANMTQKESDIAFAKNLFKDGEEFFKNSKGDNAYGSGSFAVYAKSCYKPLMAVRLYSLTNDEAYIKEATSFVGSHRIWNHARDFDRVAKAEPQHPGLICGALLANLYEATQKERYLSYAKNFLQYYASHNIDYSSKPLATGDGAFARVAADGGVFKHSSDTLMFINLLLRMPEAELRVPKSLISSAK